MNENSYSNMDKEAYQIAYLIAGYIRNTLTEKEHLELDDWINVSDQNMQLFENLTDERNVETNLEWMDKVQSEQMFKQLHESGAFAKPPVKKTRIMWAAAASVILVTGVFFIYYLIGNNKTDDPGLAVSGTTMLHPGGDRATLTLSDGSVIDLTTEKNGIIQIGVGSHVSKPVDGELVYEKSVSLTESDKVHTLSTPVGGQYQVTLQDGTKVWLNAATILKYPLRFSSAERRVELSGEAYFEVSKNDKQPFRVMLADSASIVVLGTHFDIMAYQNENAKEITLLEGKVAVNTINSKQDLNPGMQARIVGWDVSTNTNVDTEKAIAWKNGLFVFHDASIETIMRQVERWYDAKVVYEGKIKQQFNATIRRSEPLSKLLRLLELNGYVKFKVENKTIYVLP